jgi:CO/xanthine dehydrogenase Mo-binding subunit
LRTERPPDHAGRQRALERPAGCRGDADTLEQAEFAATLVAVDYAREPAHVSFDQLKAGAVVPQT